MQHDSTEWTDISIDLSSFSGQGSDPVMFGFLGTVYGQQGSGWAIDNVHIYSPDPPPTLIDYYIYVDDSLIGATENDSIFIPEIADEQVHNICVAAHYPSGLSSMKCITFRSASIEDHLPLSNIQVYPNPAKDHVYIKSSITIISISIFNSEGKLLATPVPDNGDRKYLISSLFQDGVYILKIQTVRGTVFKKMIILN